MYKTAITVLKSLADSTRISIVHQLTIHKEMSCQESLKKFNLSQPTLWHHFNKLVEAEILLERKEGKWRYYRLNRPYLQGLGIDIDKLSRSLQKDG